MFYACEVEPHIKFIYSFINRRIKNQGLEFELLRKENESKTLLQQRLNVKTPHTNTKLTKAAEKISSFVQI